jgi:threonine/homoserine/homoserine lactone efflux protein
MLPAIIFVKGMLIGLAIAAPVGPVGVMCIRSTLSRGWRAGVATGLGAAVGDGFFGAAAAFGIVLITGFIETHSALLRLVGGCFLLYLAGKTLITPPAEAMSDPGTEHDNSKPSAYLVSHFFSTLFLTITNPATLLSFMAVFAVAGITVYENPLYSFLTVLGVFSGSLLWWFILSSATFHAGKKMVIETLHKVNLFSGLLILAFGIAALVSLVVK